MEQIIAFSQEAFFYRALFAAGMVGVICGILGVFIVLRNMSLIGDALAHAILPGVVLAVIFVGGSVISFFYGSVLAGLVTVIIITWIQQNVSTKNDAAIGIVFTTMYSIGVIGISRVSSEGVHLDLKDFLVGNVLGVSNEDLYLTLGVLIYVVLSVVLLYRYLFAITFQSVIAKTMGIPVQMIHYFLMLLLSFAVVASVRTVGIILEVAMLITPAATAILLFKRLHQVIIASGLIGLLATTSGLLVAIALDAPPAPMMAVVAALFYLVAVFFAPKKGLFFKMHRRNQLQRKIRWEDIIKQAYRLNENEGLTISNLSERLQLNTAQLQRSLNLLKNKGFFEKNELQLTDKGRDAGKQLVRAHRLWETYLVEKLGLAEHQIHEDAEKYEHLLSEELVDEVEDRLGYPETDPHGSPIPTKIGGTALATMQLKDSATITHHQISNLVTARLWDLGLMPDVPISVHEKTNTYIAVQQAERTIKIPAELARAVAVEMGDNI